MTYSLEELFRNSSHKISLFKPEEISYLENLIYTKNIKGVDVPFMKCLIRDKEIKLTPEETVRQLYIYRLIHEYGYSKEQIALEHAIHFGREVKRADIVIFDSKRVYIIVETKKPDVLEGKSQLKSYCNSTGAAIAVWTNGQGIEYYHRKDPNIFESISDIPDSRHTLRDILAIRWTLNDLKKKDKLVHEKRTLKSIIQEIEDDVLANAGVDAFEEIFKLIYTKLFDEYQSGRDSKRFLEFRKYETDEKDDEADKKLFENIQSLFEKAQKKWPDVFYENSKFALTASHLSVCVAALQDVKLFNSNLDVVDDAFEYLMNKSQKGEKGQFFTPRYIIDMCVKMLNPQKHESMIDTAAGSCGFPVHTMFHVWRQIYIERGLEPSDFFTAAPKIPECEDYVREKVFAIDFDEKTVRVSRLLNLIAGDGKTNVLHFNTLDYDRWDEVIKTEKWRKLYNDGWQRFMDFRAERDSNSRFNFDIVMANPPFAGDIKEPKILINYKLSENSKGKPQSKVGRDILFIERNLNFLKPGGRMAVVLPQGRFNNSSDKYIRDFIMERCRILAVVGLHGNVFKPHTGTKTSVLFVQKWDDELCPRREDYPIFFATMQRPSKDNSGDKIYCKDEKGAPLLDSHGHMIVDHDLFNHEGLTQDGIAEAFIEFAKKEKLSFFALARPFDEARYKSLMDGLECCELMLSEISNLGRIDAEYYSKQNVHLQAILDSFEKSIADYGGTLDCSAFYPSVAGYYSNNRKNIPFLRVNEINNGWVNITDATVFLPPKVLEENKSTIAIAYPGDILITKGGTVAKIGLVTEDFKCYATSRDVIILRTGKLKGLNKYFLWAFLHSSYGKGILCRAASQTIQPHLTLPAILKIKVPDVYSIQDSVEALYKKSVELKKTSDNLYSAAQTLLQNELGLESFSPSKQNITQKSLSEVFQTGRLDAEYFMPKYDEVDKILSNSGTLEETCEIYSANFNPEAKTEYKYIELANVGTNGNITGATTANGEDLPTRARRIVHTGQVIISSIEGSMQSCALITDEYDNALCSTGFYVLDSEFYNSETLLILFKTPLMQSLLQHGCSGTILTAISDDELKKIKMPYVNAATQAKIASSIQESFSLRRQSERLINLAVRAVEIAIEQGEEQARDYIKQNTPS